MEYKNSYSYFHSTLLHFAFPMFYKPTVPFSKVFHFLIRNPKSVSCNNQVLQYPLVVVSRTELHN